MNGMQWAPFPGERRPALAGGGDRMARASLVLLLVEDNDGDADLVRDLLDQVDQVSYQVEHAPTMRQALAILGEKAIDVVLLDLRLPDTEGLESVRSLRALSGQVPIVVLTGADDDALAFSCIDAGAQDFLLKNEIRGLTLRRAIGYAISRLRERHQAAEQLAESEERYRLLFEENPHPMWVFDPESLAFRVVNDAALRLLGYSREEMLKMRLADLYPTALEDLGTPPGLTVYRSCRRKDGHPAEIAVATKVVRHGGRPARLAVATDVTEKRRLEQQLLQSQKMEAIGLLAGGVAHDFNNLLGVIIGYCELISHDLAADSAAAKRLDQIAKAADRAAGLTRQLLAFGRKQVMQPKVLDLGEVVSNVVRMLRRLIGENIELETRSQADLGRVFADPGQLEQVIVNLTVNARDAMPTGGRLLLTTRNVALEAGEVAGAEAGLYVCLQVADNGCGMSAETLGQIFEPFFTTKEAGKGTGLGLSTVYGIVKQSGGHLAVASSLGSGTTFEVYLPRTEGRLEELRETRQQPSLRGSETVMVVEDADALRAIVREVLEQVGYRVLEAADPAAAVAVARSFVGRIHLVLSDVVLPGASGAEVVRQLQALQPGIRAVFMSGYTDEAIGRHGFLERGTHFLQKPFTSALLRQKLREALDAPEEDPADLPA